MEKLALIYPLAPKQRKPVLCCVKLKLNQLYRWIKMMDQLNVWNMFTGISEVQKQLMMTDYLNELWPQLMETYPIFPSWHFPIFCLFLFET